MRPCQLTFSAFGPYPTSNYIDFELLQQRQIFAITGPTGSGKTTIFDAICYALYGVGSGSERANDMFRSQHSDLATPTYVKLCFEVKSKKYTITRWPAQMRASKRGSGQTFDEARVELELDDKIINRHKQVNDYINELLGMNKEQFKQIVLLPQGEFKKLLMSNSRDKEEIFRKIFDTSMISKMQQKLQADKTSLEKEMTLITNKINALTMQLGKNVTEEQVNLIKVNASYNCQQIASAISDLENKLTTLNKQLDDTNLVAKLQTDLKVYDSNLEQVVAKQATIEQYKTVLKLQKPISKFQIHNQKLNQITSTIKNQAIELETLNRQIECGFKEQKELTANLDIATDKLQTISSIEREIDTLEKIEQSLKQYAKLQTEDKNLSEQIDKIQVTLESDKQHYQANLKQQEMLQSQVKMLKNYELTITQCEIQKAELQTVLNYFTQQERAVLKQESVMSKYLANNQKYVSQSEHVIYLNDNFIKEQAAYIAENLSDMQKCPVCGSQHHPNLATFSKEHVDATQIEAETETLKLLENEHITLKEQLATVKAQIANYQNLIGDYQKEQSKERLMKVEDELRQAQQQLALTCDANIKLETIDSKIATQIQQISASEQELHKLQLMQVAVHTKLVEMQTQTASYLNQNVDERLQSLKNESKQIQSKHQALTQEVNQINLKITKLQAKQEGLTQQINNHQEEKQQLEKLVVSLQSQLTTIDSKHLKLNIEQIQLEVDEYNEQVVNLNTKIEQVNLQIASLESFDSDALQQQIHKHSINLECLQTLNEQFKLRHQLAIQIDEQLKLLLKSNSKFANKYRDIEVLSNIASGRIGSKISFERYVLAVYFKRIINSANLYFQKMTNNRFTLIYQATGKKNEAQGLGLDIYDMHTDASRDVKSLSGGESFKASLALALGLSDIIGSESGGIQIQTMFIDEGFGSLDEESLAAAIDTLLEVETSGRIIGLISHVDQLKTQVENKITINSTNQGSSLQVEFS